MKKSRFTDSQIAFILRQAFAIYTLDSRAEPKAVAEVMGHSDMAMIYKHYQHVLEHQRKAVMDTAPLPDLGTLAGHMPPLGHT